MEKLEEMSKEELIAKLKEQNVEATKEQPQEPVEKQKPLHSGYWALGEGKGIRYTVWLRNVNLERTERQPDGSWKKTQELSLAKPILEKFFIRIPKFYEIMSRKEEKQ
jgi:hypothetical protein